MENTNKIEVKISRPFIENCKGGNAAGVVFNADNLSNEQKLSIVSKIGLSETAFVSESKIADFKLDFFTPTRQIAHCGHATIAAFSYMAQEALMQNGTSVLNEASKMQNSITNPALEA